jgi:UPF0716 protein FxsA
VPLLIVLVWFAAEIAAFVEVAAHIGILLAVVLVLVVSASGPFLVRRAGLGVLAHARERLARGESPNRELLDGVVLLLGGFLVCVPGFISDVVGLALLIGPVRHLAIRATGRHLARRVASADLLGTSRIWAGGRRPGGPVVDVTSPAERSESVVDLTDHELPEGDGPDRPH